MAVTENVTIKQLVLRDPRRQSGWTFLGTLVDSDSSVTSVTLEDLDLPEAWSGPQCVKAISSCKWTEFVITNTKKNNSFKREDVNPFYDNLVTGLAANKTVTHLALKNISGASNGDISRLIDGIRKNRSITHLNLSLEDVWDRIKIKCLADYIRSSTSLEELVIAGVDQTIFDINDFVSALTESTTLRKLNISQLEIPGPGKKVTTKGLVIDSYLQEKLKKICETNGKLYIYGIKEGAIPKEIVISPVA